MNVKNSHNYINYKPTIVLQNIILFKKILSGRYLKVIGDEIEINWVSIWEKIREIGHWTFFGLVSFFECNILVTHIY